MTAAWTTTGPKQGGDNSRWQHVWEHIRELYPQERAAALVEQAVEEVRRTVGDRRAGWGWSGGKDSQALRVVMERAGVGPCVLGVSGGLEYGAFLAWVQEHRPPQLEVIANTDLTLPWLAAHPDMLFPRSSAAAARWFKLIQHRAQERFFRGHGLDVLILGRRLADRNHVGDAQTGVYTNGRGITRYSPLRRWMHEDVLAVCAWYDVPLPPCYGWPDGWVVGTGAWPARQWTGSTAVAWAQVYAVEPAIVLEAASVIDSARQFLDAL